MSKYYTGIGARRTPHPVLIRMKKIACGLEKKGYVLRSGGASGADTAFENGIKGPDHKQIFLPWKGYNGNESHLFKIRQEALDMAMKYHPAWHTLSPAIQLIMARNCYQVLGQDLCTLSKFIVCWTPGGKMVGGTAQALRIAIDHDIPIINLATWKKKI